ncbi:uncharacterized protein [Haliotis asinina]|uniref:uncharacterized protein n=1 Tax=Haliotis asinina TaxID=109174 RepID=UPI0035321D82
MSKLTIVAFLVTVGVLAINGLRVRPIYNYESPELRLIPGRNGHPRLVRVYDRPDKPDHLVITQGRGAHRRTYVTDNVDNLYDHPLMGAHVLPSHHAYSTLGKRKRRSILHPFHRAPLMHPLLARNIGLGLALRARALGALSYRNRILGAHGLLGRHLLRPAVKIAQVATPVGQHKTPAPVTKVATKQAPAPLPSAPAVVPSKAVDPYPAPADVYQPGPGIDTGIPTYVEQVGHPYHDIFDQQAGGQPLYEPVPAGSVELGGAGSIYNDPAVQSASGIYDQANANVYNDLAVQSANGIYDQPGQPIYDPTGQPVDLYNGPGAPYNDPAGAQVLTGSQSGPVYEGTNGAPDLFNNGIDVYSTDLGASLGASKASLGLGDYIIEGNGQSSYILDNNPSSIGVSSGTAGPEPAPRFM